MLGIFPGKKQTFIVSDYFNDHMEEGKYYADPKTKFVYLYSTIMKRSTPSYGYFPIYDGKNKIQSTHSKMIHVNQLVPMDVNQLIQSIDSETAKRIKYDIEVKDYDADLTPSISDEDNVFTQCIKGILIKGKYNLLDLQNLSKPKLDMEKISSYYHSLNKISFMRLSKFEIWLNVIFHMTYRVDIFKSDQCILSYDDKRKKFHPSEYLSIERSESDPFKKMANILIQMDHITKERLREGGDNDYTINNMLTTIYGEKPISAQLFSRFIRMSGLGFLLQILDKEDVIFSYREGVSESIMERK